MLQIHSSVTYYFVLSRVGRVIMNFDNVFFRDLCCEGQLFASISLVFL